MCDANDRIFHIVEAGQWTQAEVQGRYTGSTRGLTLAQVGFIHCSWWAQVAPTAEFIYAGVHDPLVVVEIDVDMLEAAGVQVRHEHANPDDASSPLFPHIYGPLPTACVCRVLTAGFDDHGVFVVDREADA